MACGRAGRALSVDSRLLHLPRHLLFAVLAYRLQADELGDLDPTTARLVGTTNKSMAAMSGAWFRRKLRHPWLGGPHRLTMIGHRRLCDLKAKLKQFTMDARRSPQRFVDAHLLDQSAQPRINLWPPSPRTRFPTPVAAKAGPMPTNDRLRLDDGQDPQDRRKPVVKLDQKQPIEVRELDSAARLAP